MRAYLIIAIAFSCQLLLAQYPAYMGGVGDGNTQATLSAASALNFYRGGANDGFAYSGTEVLNPLNIFKGGANDGFAYSGTQVISPLNIYNGGANDGFAYNGTVVSNPLNIYAGGTNDGIGYAQLTPATALNFYRGGLNDGFAMATSTISAGATCGVSFSLQNSSLTNITKHSATFTWNKYNSGATSYTLLLRDGSVEGTIIRNIAAVYEGNTTTIEFTGLAAGGYYCFNLQEHCGPGQSSAPSPHFCFFTYPDDCPTPTMPQHLSSTGSSVGLGWTPGVTTGGVSNNSYEIELTPTGSSSNYNYGGTVSGTPMSRTITCLPTNTFFTFRIREQCGVNKYSDYITGTTYTSAACVAPTDLATTVTNSQNATLSWNSYYYDNVNRPYQISYGTGITSAGQGTLTSFAAIQPSMVSGSTRSHNLYIETGVSNVVWYVRELCGMCDTTAWAGPYTIPVLPCTAPLAAGISTTAITETQATLNWQTVNNSTSALVEVRNQSNGTSVYYNVPTAISYSHSQTIYSLTAATTYNWRIKQYCPNGDTTAYTAWKEFVTPGGSACPAPTGLGVKFTSGAYLMSMWYSVHYPSTCCAANGFKYQLSSGDNITSPTQGTIVTDDYYFTQYPQHASYPFFNGNHPGFTFYVRDICGPGDTSVWVGPYVVGSAKTDETTNQLNQVQHTVIAALDMYPNPNNGKELNVHTAGWAETIHLTIYNLQGAIVWKGYVAANGDNKLSLDVPDATYICRFVAGEQTRTERLVIQR